MSALKSRWQEEKLLLAEELRRTVRFFRYYHYRWGKTALDYEEQGKLGHAAHARRYVALRGCRRRAHVEHDRMAYEYERRLDGCKAAMPEEIELVSSAMICQRKRLKAGIERALYCLRG